MAMKNTILKETVWGAVPLISAKEFPKCFNIMFTI